MRFQHYILALLLTLFSFLSFGQKDAGSIVFFDKNEVVKCKGSFTNIDSLAILRYFRRCILVQHEKGYIEARIDSIAFNQSSVIAYAFKGNRYRWAEISVDRGSIKWFNKAGISPHQYNGKPIKPSRIIHFSENVIRYLENNGYPFAKLIFNNTIIENHKVSTNLSVDPGPFIGLDTLYVKGDAKISSKFLHSYLDFSKGNPYSDGQILKYDQKLRALGFISIIRPTEVEFVPNKARVYTYITNRKSSRFSGIVGFQSGSNESKGIKLTGDINLLLNNAFRNGERNSILWQAPGEGTQRLNVSTIWPYIFAKKIGANANFTLYRRDSTYINLNPKIMIDFYFYHGNSLGIGLDHRSSSTISTLTNSSIADYKTTFYQIAYSSGIKNNEIFPLKDLWISTSIGVGTRKAELSNLSNSYESSTVGEIKATISTFFPLLSNFMVFHFLTQAQAITFLKSSNNQSQLLENELYRIGGYGTLRGFNQESILSDGYAIATTELQFRMQSIINIILFYDLGYVSSYSASTRFTSWPNSVGFGFQLASTAGILNLSYAIGSGFGQQLSIRNARVHVGYTANF
jgi:outer membrane protein assembly factor BamA